MDGTGRLFAPFVEYLPRDWKVAIVQYPKDTALGYEALEMEAKKAIPAIGDYVVLGESFSGPIAISLANSADSRFLGLVLCCTFTQSPSKLLRCCGWALSKFPVSIVPFFIIERVLLGSFRSDTLSNLLHSVIRSVSDAAYKSRLEAIQKVDVSAKLACLALPVLYLRAARDQLVGAEESEKMRSILKHMTIVEINGPALFASSFTERGGK